MQIFFCDRCSSRITEGELASEDAFEFGTLKFCADCWQSDQVRELVRRQSGLMAAVTEGGAGAAYDDDPGEPAAPSHAHATRSSGRHRKHRPSPKRLRAVEHQTDRANGRHRAAPQRCGVALTMLVFGVAAAVAFLVMAGIMMIASNDRSRGSLPVPGPSRRAVCVEVHEAPPQRLAGAPRAL